jgi:hypothetical protein
MCSPPSPLLTVDVSKGLFSFFQSTSLGAKVRSPFVSMAWGRGDSFASAEELATTTSGVQCFTPAHIPVIDFSHSGRMDKYLPLFYVMGRETLQNETEIPASEMYEVLQGFSCFLNCISETLVHFLVVNEGKRNSDLKKERLFVESLKGMAQRYHQKFEREYKKKHLTLR